jgi:hypothetical protein
VLSGNRAVPRSKVAGISALSESINNQRAASNKENEMEPKMRAEKEENYGSGPSRTGVFS